MKINTTSEGSTEPQINTAHPFNGDRSETVTVPNAMPVTKRYRLVCEGTSMWIKAHKLSKEELRIAQPAIEERGFDLYTLSCELEQHGFKLDIGNPNHYVEYDCPLADEVYFTLYDAEGLEVLSFDPMQNGDVDPKCSTDVAPQRDGTTIVNLEWFGGEIDAYTLETADVPLKEDFSTSLYEVRIGDETLRFVNAVMYKGESLGVEGESSGLLVQDEDFKSSWATLV